MEQADSLWHTLTLYGEMLLLGRLRFTGIVPRWVKTIKQTDVPKEKYPKNK